MNDQNFSYSFLSSQTPEVIFDLLLQIDNWWAGIYGETIEGKSQKLNDVFSFRAGQGMHYSKQKLVELVRGKHIAWQVDESELTFLNNTDEWTGTQFSFDITPDGNKTKITFTHTGLTPQLECYDNCSTGWTHYLNALKEKLS